MSMDFINGMFEFCGAMAVLTSVRAIIVDRCYAGLSRWNLLFFFSWGLWNVVYYPTIDQWWSFFGGCWLAVANCVYLFCLWWYPHRSDTPIGDA